MDSGLCRHCGRVRRHSAFGGGWRALKVGQCHHDERCQYQWHREFGKHRDCLEVIRCGIVCICLRCTSPPTWPSTPVDGFRTSGTNHLFLLQAALRHLRMTNEMNQQGAMTTTTLTNKNTKKIPVPLHFDKHVCVATIIMATSIDGTIWFQSQLWRGRGKSGGVVHNG